MPSMLPTDPPRNAAGETLPHGHQDIVSADRLIKGVPLHHLVEEVTGVAGVMRLSSMAFNASTGVNEGVSCELERLLNADKITAESRINANPKWVGGIALVVKEVRDYLCLVGYDPIENPPPPNPYHCQIWALKPFPESFKQQLLKISRWVVKPLSVR